MSDEFQNVLAIDTAMSGCSACVLKGTELFSRSEDMPRGQAVHLVPMINDVIAKAGLNHGDLDAVVTTNGPGAFTGLRIGLSTAKAMAMALGVPVFGVTTLQALALSYVDEAEGAFTALVETRREEFYAQSFDVQGGATCEVTLVRVDEIEDAPAFIGDGAVRFKSLRSEASIAKGFELPNVGVMARALIDAPSLFTRDPAAVYLRGADVSVSKKIQRTIA